MICYTGREKNKLPLLHNKYDSIHLCFHIGIVEKCVPSVYPTLLIMEAALIVYYLSKSTPVAPLLCASVRRPCARQKPIRDKIDKSSSPHPSLHLPPAAPFKVPLRLRLRGEEFTPTFMYVLFSEANRHKFPWRASCRCSSLRLLSQFSLTS